MIDQTYPKIDLNTPKIELGTPKIDLNIPKIELGNPKINLESSLLLTQMVASSVQGLLSLGIIADATDLKRVTAAMEFLRNPTGNFAVLSKHIGDIAESLGMAEAMAEPLPGAVYGLHSCLVKLEVRHHIDSAKMAFGIESHDSAEVTHLLILARDAAKILADGYKDSTLLVEVERLIVQMLGISLEEFLEQYKLNKMR